MKEKHASNSPLRFFLGADGLCRLAILLALAGLFPHAVGGLADLVRAVQGTASAHPVTEKGKP